jgi:hypothetical protein
MPRHQLNPAAQQIVGQLQQLADQLGHPPTREDWEAADIEGKAPLWRINSLLHSFEKAVDAHVVDPRERDLSAEQAVALVESWSLENKELLTKTAWERSRRDGNAELPPFERLVEASGHTENRLQFIGHDALAKAGYEPTGKARTRYEKPRPASAEVTNASTRGRALRGVRTHDETDAKVNQLLAEDAAARREAGVKQGKVQTERDRAGAEDWLGL